jgi:hypothetical protein
MNERFKKAIEANKTIRNWYWRNYIKRSWS